MNSRVVTSIVTAVFVVAPLVCFAQGSFSSSRGQVQDKTLLTGPYLPSPASPPQSPVAGQQWIFIKRANPAEAGRAVGITHSATAGHSSLLPKGAYSLSNRGGAESSPLITQSNQAAPGSSQDINATPQIRFVPADETTDPHGQLRAAEERSRRLRVEREDTLKRKSGLEASANRASANPLPEPAPTALPPDPIRFDANVPAMPTHLLPSTPKSTTR